MKFELHIPFVFLFLIFCSSAIAQDSIEVTGYAEGRAFASGEELPFWMYTNTNGFLSNESTVGVSAFAKAHYDLSKSHSLNLGIGGFLRNGTTDTAQRSDLFLAYINKLFTVTVGSKSPEIVRQNLSTINDNILFTGNSRALPGALIETSGPIKLGDHFTLSGQFAHYRLNDDRFIKDVNVHYKSLELGWNFNNQDRISTGLRHYVQWGGVSGAGVQFPNGFKDLIRVFFGQGANNDSFNSESKNAIGNHLGTYELKYSGSRKNWDFEVYHHTLFDDRSGRELNNFPDGVWGLHLKPKNSSWLQGILYEYVQTVSQSGRPRTTVGDNQQSGGDNYFRNGIYNSGWTYEGQTIGLPFIRPLNSIDNPTTNRSIAHHLGLFSKIERWEITGKLTYLQSLGTYIFPLDRRERQVLSYAEVAFKTESLGQFRLYFGADILNTRENNFGIGVGYRYFLK